MFAPTCQRYTSATGWNRNHSECHTCHAKWRPFQTWEHRMHARARYDARHIELGLHRCAVPLSRHFHGWAYRSQHLNCKKKLSSSVLPAINSDILSGMCWCPSMAHCIRSRLHPELAIWSSGLRGEEGEGGTTRRGRRKKWGIAPLSKSRDPNLAGEKILS